MLLCNRDELLTRVASSDPEVRLARGIRVLAPVDGGRGGSWIASNELGLSVCLLNGTAMTGRAARVREAPTVSRGTVLMNLAGAQSLGELREWIRAAEFQSVAPFTVAAIQPGKPAAIFEWNGGELAEDLDGERHMPLVSSSFAAGSVREWRRREFRRMAGRGIDDAVLYAFHESHRGGPSAYSTCMHRPGAATVSFSSVEVSRASIAFSFAAHAPCRIAPGACVGLARAN
ncbi:MAG: NRDE family protein [Bryobacteraceae bacterium]